MKKIVFATKHSRQCHYIARSVSRICLPVVFQPIMFTILQWKRFPRIITRNNDGWFGTTIGGTVSCMGYVDVIDGKPQFLTIYTLTFAKGLDYIHGPPNRFWESNKVKGLLETYASEYKNLH
jgi:hypothetical protein